MWYINLTYIVFVCAVLSLWLPVRSKIKPWMLIGILSLAFAMVSHTTNWYGALSILLFYAIVSIYLKTESRWKYPLWIMIFILALALELHQVPGFKNLLIWSKIHITPDARAFTLYLNFDKASVGLILLGLTLKLAQTRIEWSTLLKQMIVRVPLIILILLCLSIFFGYVKFTPKIPHDLWIWVVSNLFFTCLAEEAFFRGFLQHSFSQLKYRYATYLEIGIPALFFGCIHYPGGVKYVVLAIVAGVLYGWIYKVTKRIEASILAHFLLNLVHILFFTYPALGVV